MRSMMTFDASEAPLLFVAATALLLATLAVVLYITEVRRVGTGSWSECYNDRVVPVPVLRPDKTPSTVRHGHRRAPRSEHPARAA